MPPFLAPVKNNADSASSQSSIQQKKCSNKKASMKSTQDVLEGVESIIEKMANTSKEKIYNIEEELKLKNKTKTISEITISKQKIVKQAKKVNAKSNPKNKIIDGKQKKPRNVLIRSEKKVEKKRPGKDCLNKIDKSKSKIKLINKKLKLMGKKTLIDSLEPVQDSESMTQTFSQNFSAVFRKVVLSQPPKMFEHKQRLIWLQERREAGIWVECCQASCKKWRYIQDIHDPLQIPEKWYCEMNSDPTANSCNKEEQLTNVFEEEDLIHAPYSAGSLVWAHLDGFPWWPAMVDDCPDTEQYYWLDGFSDIPNYYNVTFFDSSSVTRAWIATEKLKPYFVCGKKVIFEQSKIPVSMERRMKIAKQQVEAAIPLTVLERLQKYSFITRYKGPINSPGDCESINSDSESDYSDSENDKSGKELTMKIFGIENLNKSPPDIDHVLPKYQEITAKINKEQDKLIKNSACSISEENVEQSQIACTQDTNKRLSQNMVKSGSFSNQTHSNTCLDMSVALGSEKTVTRAIDLMGDEETEESIFRNLCTSDAIVPSTETNIVDLNLDDSEIMSQKSLDFEMF